MHFEIVRHDCIGGRSKLCDPRYINGSRLIAIPVKYVSLLAFKTIAASHPSVLASHQEVVFGCLDDADVSIRLQALEIGAKMIDVTNLRYIVSRLMRQLHDAPLDTSDDAHLSRKGRKIEITGELEGDTAQAIPSAESAASALPPDYRAAVIEQILEFCSRDSFASIDDFEWYLQILVDLLHFIPSRAGGTSGANSSTLDGNELSAKIGFDLRNVAVRVRSVRAAAVEAANSIIAFCTYQSYAEKAHATGGSIGVLVYAVWIVGEYSDALSSAQETLSLILLLPLHVLSSAVLGVCLQAIPKLLSQIVQNESSGDNPRVDATIPLFKGRITNVLEPLRRHPDPEVQERAVECLMLARFSMTFAARDDANNTCSSSASAWARSILKEPDLNPVAASAQKKVPVPDEVNFAEVINPQLVVYLDRQDGPSWSSQYEVARNFYSQRLPLQGSGFSRNGEGEQGAKAAAADLLSPADSSVAKHKPGFATRYRDDPFYISGTPLSSTFQTSNVAADDTNLEHELDMESIPIMDLGTSGYRGPKLDKEEEAGTLAGLRKGRAHVTAEETLELPNHEGFGAQLGANTQGDPARSVLQVDSSGVGTLDLAGDGTMGLSERREEEASMANALADVERVRMEMQRASDRSALANDLVPDGVLVKKKTKKKHKKVAKHEDALQP